MRDTELKLNTGEHRGDQKFLGAGQGLSYSSYWSPAGCRCNAWLRIACGKSVRKTHLEAVVNGSDWVGIAPLLVLQVASELGLAQFQNPTKA